MGCGCPAPPDRQLPQTAPVAGAILFDELHPMDGHHRHGSGCQHREHAAPVQARPDPGACRCGCLLLVVAGEGCLSIRLPLDLGSLAIRWVFLVNSLKSIFDMRQAHVHCSFWLSFQYQFCSFTSAEIVLQVIASCA